MVSARATVRDTRRETFGGVSHELRRESSEAEEDGRVTSSLRVAGVDLAAEPAGTALAVLQCEPGAAGQPALVQLASLELGLDDAALVAGTRDCTLVGIDCALGWPAEFVRFVGRHAEGHPPGETDSGDKDWRRSLAYRETDRVVREVSGRWPLSVATDRLGLTALRCAVLVDRFAADGRVVDRSGAAPSGVVEVYPAMALRHWGLTQRQYKTDVDARRTLIAALEQAAPWLDVSAHRELMTSSADALDAVIAALVALAHALGATLAPTAAQVALARVEGWIAMPTLSLAELGARALAPTPTSAPAPATPSAHLAAPPSALPPEGE